MGMPLFLCRLLLVPPLVLALGCTSNHPVSVTPDPVQLSQYLEAHPTEDLRVTDTAGHRYWLHNPAVQNDSLVGVKSRAEPNARRALPLAEIRELQRPEFDTGKTLVLGGGIVFGMVTVVALAVDGGSDAVLLPE